MRKIFLACLFFVNNVVMHVLGAWDRLQHGEELA
jgi:hypothetical protein